MGDRSVDGVGERDAGANEREAVRRQVRAGLRKNGESLFHYGAVNNFALTLGIYPLLWLVPTRTGIEGNGIFFPERGLGADRAW